jgi:predicted Zn-dependent protease
MKRFVGFLLIALFGISCYRVLSMEEAAVYYHKEPVTVYSGDSLWSIASRCMSEDEDIRAVIDRITTINHLQPNQVLQPGQKLLVPVKSHKARLALR